MEFHGEVADALFTDRSRSLGKPLRRGARPAGWGIEGELVGLLPVQGIELWWLVGGVLVTGRARA